MKSVLVKGCRRVEDDEGGTSISAFGELVGRWSVVFAIWHSLS